ncbi:DUF3152 domain-containing protein [Umezawaea sp. Da 62-37]|uniref:DUF3152 domain-containing protein n=1 Tax=Umezawaea sp. Da 62-37 TaxID=3075927 RepID=UPI0028F6CDD1|nr:DUF3152 domain-containing protein [Umezawaea sp. Da 62-37]WNV83935.1 DUF3152 domain-containing protein [Umezawaea sp. Da 62-37]
MPSRTPGLRHVLGMAGMCTLSIAVLATMQLAGSSPESDHQGPAVNRLITVRAAPPSGSEPGGRPVSMGAAGRSSADLPDGPPVPVTGSGTWRVVPGAVRQAYAGHPDTYSVEIEDGVRLVDGDVGFGRFVDGVLHDPRSWIGDGVTALQRIEHGVPDLRIRLTSQNTARALCGYELPFDTSCRIDDAVYLSAARWIRGATSFSGRMDEYRQYMVNHEVGHFLGHEHELCDISGSFAPVMMQQTFSTRNDELADITATNPQQVDVPKDGKVCTPNAWPYPHATR